MLVYMFNQSTLGAVGEFLPPDPDGPVILSDIDEARDNLAADTVMKLRSNAPLVAAALVTLFGATKALPIYNRFKKAWDVKKNADLLFNPEKRLKFINDNETTIRTIQSDQDKFGYLRMKTTLARKQDRMARRKQAAEDRRIGKFNPYGQMQSAGERAYNPMMKPEEDEVIGGGM